jgi:hypothetical protein
MANEDKVQKQMEFIVEQQAQFASDIGQLKDIVSRLAKATLDRFEDSDNTVTALINAQMKTEGNVSTLAAKMVELADAQAHTDQRLNVLIDIVGNRHNGKSQG